MSSAALDAALAEIDTVFGGFASPEETGCGYCHLPEELAHLRTPDRPIPVDVVSYFLFEVPDHFDDHPAVMRRLLPQVARAMTDGGLGGIAHGAHGLSRVDWQLWPAEQVTAIEAFLHAWWRAVVVSPEPPYDISDIFDTCVTIARTVTPFLDTWGPGRVADAHLARCADVWLDDLLSDSSPFTWWYDDTVDAGLADLRTWLAGPGLARLHEAGEYDLATRVELLALS
ncbi:hypothetical protein [Streptomyces sp. NPDC098781]|uniref:hypothetical protein n=1 Tax=Streptomyces sp. NPDC098781 TaxID=3366097 RepID=UPI0037F6C7F5